MIYCVQTYESNTWISNEVAQVNSFFFINLIVLISE